MQKIYQDRRNTFLEATKQLNQKLRRISLLRILAFLLLIIVPVYFADANQEFFCKLSIAILLPVFAALVSWYLKVKKEVKLHQYLAAINDEEMLRFHHKLEDEHLDGNEFIDFKHAYSYDLDIFGRSSMFLQLNRTTTQLGKTLLANWVSYKTTVETIQTRQAATEDLKDKLDWRQHFQAHGKFKNEKAQQTKALIRWIQTPFEFNRSKLILVCSWIFPTFSLFALGMVIFADWHLLTLVAGLTPSFLLVGSMSKVISKSIEQGADCVEVLENYAKLIELIESESFEHPHLQSLQQKLSNAQSEVTLKKASKAVQKLSTILYHLELRKNPYFYALFVMWTLYDVHWFFALDSWKQKYQSSVEPWLQVVAEFDALNSLAGFAVSNPTYTLPTISDKSYFIDAQELGHPLLPADVRVCNDFQLSGKGSTAIITGSNMSGKSTFERTLSLNIVLALMGAPVCAKQLNISLIQVFTSMRTQDSLSENVSGFYAELKRLRQLLDQVETGEPTFYVLDEVLKGTNSQDRQSGAKAIILKMADMPAFGLISTHDLELGDLENQFPDKIKNFSFNSQIIDNQLTFNYKISREVCHSFSASKLMESIGIMIE